MFNDVATAAADADGFSRFKRPLLSCALAPASVSTTSNMTDVELHDSWLSSNMVLVVVVAAVDVDFFEANSIFPCLLDFLIITVDFLVIYHVQFTNV